MPAKKTSDNKTIANKLSVTDFVGKISDTNQRADAKSLITLMQKVTKEKPTMWGPAIIGFGSYHYVYDTGREGDMPLISFSPRKAGTAIYVNGGFPESDALRAKLKQRPKGCLNIKKLADVDPQVLETLVTKSVANTRKQHQS